MKPGKLYKHRSMVDIVMWPMTIVDRGDQLSISCRWVNITNPNKPFVHNGVDVVDILKSDIYKWHEYAD